MVGKTPSSSRTKKVLFVGMLVAGLLLSSQIGWGAVVNFNPKPLNASIIRDGSAVASPLFNEAIPGVSAPYNYVQEIFQNTSIAHSGAAVSNPSLYQHVYAYSLPNSMAVYNNVKNVSGHNRELVITPQESGLKQGAFLWAKSDVILDGFMLVAKGEQQGSTYKGVNAKFEIKVTWDFDAWGRLAKPVQIPVFTGTVNIISLPNGKPFYYTTGNISRALHISDITDNGDSFRLDFDKVHIPYRVLTRAGYNYSLTTTITSLVKTTGKGTGAEVEFGPGEPVLPTYIEGGQVPEPTTIVLLLTSSLGLLRFRRRTLKN